MFYYISLYFFLDIEEIEIITIIIGGEVAVETANLHAAAAAWTAAAVVVASQVEAAAIEAPDAAVSPSNQVKIFLSKLILKITW